MSAVASPTGKGRRGTTSEAIGPRAVATTPTLLVKSSIRPSGRLGLGFDRTVVEGAKRVGIVVIE